MEHRLICVGGGTDRPEITIFADCCSSNCCKISIAARSVSAARLCRAVEISGLVEDQVSNGELSVATVREGAEAIQHALPPAVVRIRFQLNDSTSTVSSAQLCRAVEISGLIEDQAQSRADYSGSDNCGMATFNPSNPEHVRVALKHARPKRQRQIS